jgi:hypothetical protein
VDVNSQAKTTLQIYTQVVFSSGLHHANFIFRSLSPPYPGLSFDPALASQVSAWFYGTLQSRASTHSSCSGDETQRHRPPKSPDHPLQDTTARDRLPLSLVQTNIASPTYKATQPCRTLRGDSLIQHPPEPRPSDDLRIDAIAVYFNARTSQLNTLPSGTKQSLGADSRYKPLINHVYTSS